MHVELVREAERVFPDLGHPEDVTTARIWHCKYRTLAPLSAVTRLEGLVVATYPDPSFEHLGGLMHLRYLSVLHMPKVSDIAPLAGLRNLEVLSLSTLPSWDSSSKRTRIRSLNPLLTLPKLKHVEFLGVVPEDDSLDALGAMPPLMTARLHGHGKKVVGDFFARSSAVDAFAPEPWF